MSRKLLLADDSVTIQRVIELTFSGEDVQVIAVGDGDQAIARIPVERPDIVLAAIGIPKRSGYEVAAFVKEQAELSHVPVLLLAGAFEPVDEARARQVKCDGVLVKPFEPQQVIARVRELIDGAARRETKFGTREASPEPAAAAPGTAVAAPERPTPEPPPSPSEHIPVKEPPPPEPEPPIQEPPIQEPPAREPRLPTPEIGVAAAEPSTGSLDDYFDRLDAAFATLGSTPPPPAAPAPASASLTEEIFGRVPTVDDVLGGASLRSVPETPAAAPGHIAPPPPEPPDTSPTIAPAPQPPDVAIARPVGVTKTEHAGQLAGLAEGGNTFARLFNLLWAVEQGEADPSTLRLGAAPSPPQVTDDLVEQVTRRVLERLAPDTARTLVADIVSEVAERLVREEIERIRSSR